MRLPKHIRTEPPKYTETRRPSTSEAEHRNYIPLETARRVCDQIQSAILESENLSAEQKTILVQYYSDVQLGLFANFLEQYDVIKVINTTSQTNKATTILAYSIIYNTYKNYEALHEAHQKSGTNTNNLKEYEEIMHQISKLLYPEPSSPDKVQPNIVLPEVVKQEVRQRVLGNLAEYLTSSKNDQKIDFGELSDILDDVLTSICDTTKLGDTLGVYSTYARKIFINTKAHKKEISIKDTITHEVMHSIQTLITHYWLAEAIAELRVNTPSAYPLERVCLELLTHIVTLKDIHLAPSDFLKATISPEVELDMHFQLGTISWKSLGENAPTGPEIATLIALTTTTNQHNEKPPFGYYKSIYLLPLFFNELVYLLNQNKTNNTPALRKWLTQKYQEIATAYTITFSPEVKNYFELSKKEQDQKTYEEFQKLLTELARNSTNSPINIMRLFKLYYFKLNRKNTETQLTHDEQRQLQHLWNQLPQTYQENLRERLHQH